MMRARLSERMKGPTFINDAFELMLEDAPEMACDPSSCSDSMLSRQQE